MDIDRVARVPTVELVVGEASVMNGASMWYRCLLSEKYKNKYFYLLNKNYLKKNVSSLIVSFTC